MHGSAADSRPGETREAKLNRSITCRRDGRSDSIERVQDWFPSVDLAGFSEIMLQPQAEIDRTAKMGLLQDLSDIVELDVFVFAHGPVPDAGRESGHSKKRKLTQLDWDTVILEIIRTEEWLDSPHQSLCCFTFKKKLRPRP
jgi:hypothetical protein